MFISVLGLRHSNVRPVSVSRTRPPRHQKHRRFLFKNCIPERNSGIHWIIDVLETYVEVRVRVVPVDVPSVARDNVAV